MAFWFNFVLGILWGLMALAATDGLMRTVCLGFASVFVSLSLADISRIGR